MKNATQKRSTYLERAEKILRNDINGIRTSTFNGENSEKNRKPNICINR